MGKESDSRFTVDYPRVAIIGRVRLAALSSPSEVERADWRPRNGLLMVVAGALAGLVIGVAYAVFVPRGWLAGEEYHLWRWEADTLTSNAFARLGIGPSGSAEDGEAIARYFSLTSQLRAAAEAGDERLEAALASERAAYENDVERAVEERLSEAIKSAGLRRELPLFGGVRIEWPPVDFELTSPPRILVRSPRARIERQGDRLLRPGLTLAEIESIELRADDEDTVSVVVSIGGLAAYPAIVRDDRSYLGVLETAAHEWVHHYLAFYPLGERWGEGGDAEPLNETTASIAGRELAKLVQQKHPVDLPADGDGRAPASPPPTVDFNKEMRQLRLDVDALLAEGKVAEAERLMEERRLFLARGGISIRKINQAYFAFHGTYADSPQSSNPIGPKIERVWELTGHVGLFLRAMRDVTDAQDLDRLLAVLEAEK